MEENKHGEADVPERLNGGLIGPARVRPMRLSAQPLG